MAESVPVNLLEKWLTDLSSNLKYRREESKEYADSLLLQGMREGVGQVGCKLETWCRHQKYVGTLNRLRRKFLMTRRVTLSDGRYRNLEWYENDLFITLAFRHAKDAPRGKLMLQMQNIDLLTTEYLVYKGTLSFDDLAALARKGGLEAVRTEGYWRQWD